MFIPLSTSDNRKSERIRNHDDIESIIATNAVLMGVEFDVS